MKIITKDFIKILSFFISLFIIHFILHSKFIIINVPSNMIEYFNKSLKILPFYMVVIKCYKAAITISLNITTIYDCKKEYIELIDELDKEQIKLNKKQIY